MTPQEFKIKYPCYSHLEEDELWDTMTEMLLQSDNVLIADPNRKKFYCKSVNIDGEEWLIEDESKTRWLNNKGEEVKLNIPTPSTKVTTSYKMVIWDAGETKNNKL